MSSNIDLPDILVRTPQGSLRIAGTRVSLDSVIYAFLEGATPEEICQDFSALSLAQVYATIAFYLHNREQVDAYLQEERRASENLRRELKARHGDFLKNLRQRLIAGRQSPASA